MAADYDIRAAWPSWFFRVLVLVAEVGRRTKKTWNSRHLLAGLLFGDALRFQVLVSAP